MRNLLLCFLVYFCSYAQNETGKTTVATLCSPEFHGRGYVNQGDSLAGDFLAKKFKTLGLKPIGKSYFQPFSFPVQTFPGSCTVQMDGETLIPGVHYLLSPNSGPSCETSDCQHGKTYRIIACNIEKLYKSTSSFYPCPANVILAVRTFGIGSDSLKVIKSRLQELSKFAPVIQVTNEKFTWSVSQSANNYPFISVQDSIFGKLVESTVFLHIETKFQAQHRANNVIGYVPALRQAKKKPYLFITAHYDHLGRMGQHTYFPGGNDNASGVGMLVSLAEELVKNPLADYNVVFVAFAGEEVGLLGSSYMVQHPIVPLSKIQFLLNLDIMGSGEEGITVVNSTLFKPAFDRLLALNATGNYVSLIKPRGPAANSDHYPFTEAGVPAFFIYTMGPNKNYHDIFDTYEALSFQKFDDLERLFLAFIRGF